MKNNIINFGVVTYISSCIGGLMYLHVFSDKAIPSMNIIPLTFIDRIDYFAKYWFPYV